MAHFLPLFDRGIDSGRVVTTGVQADNVTGGDFGQRVQHCLCIERSGSCVVVAVGVDFESGGGEDAGVIGPGRSTAPDPGIGKRSLQELGRHSQRPRASGCLDGGSAARGGDFVFGSKQQSASQVAELLHPVDAQVALGCLGLDQPTFGLLDAVEHRSDPGGILVDSGGEVDLALGRIGSEGLVESENGIGWSGLEVLEHQRGPGILVEPVGW